MRPLALLLTLGVTLARCSSPPGPGPDAVRVRVSGVAVDPRTGSPVVLLQEIDGERQLPIWIGFSEAHSIATELEHEKMPRPNTHDLAKRLLDRLEASLVRVVVTELRDGVYYAVVVLERHGHRYEVDARPSDAIALALRFEAPVFVRAPLFESAEKESKPPAERAPIELRGAPTPDRIGSRMATRLHEPRNRDRIARPAGIA